jgi:hypothetical protein
VTSVLHSSYLRFTYDLTCDLPTIKPAIKPAITYDLTCDLPAIKPAIKPAITYDTMVRPRYCHACQTCLISLTSESLCVRCEERSQIPWSIRTTDRCSTCKRILSVDNFPLDRTKIDPSLALRALIDYAMYIESERESRYPKRDVYGDLNMHNGSLRGPLWKPRWVQERCQQLETWSVGSESF